tara:strand:+ start:497 stop:631 length:135 start_codon:yes stop_codon:yes gene_type:complete
MNSRMPTAVTIGKKDGKSTWKHHEYNKGKDIVIRTGGRDRTKLA